MNKKFLKRNPHCLKSIHIRIHSTLHFPAIGLNAERYSISLRIKSEYGKIRTRITVNTGTFYAVPIRTSFF